MGANNYATVDFLGADNGVGFPIDAPVFNLPEGGCVNSADAHIVDNIWMGPPPPTVAISGSVSSDCDGPLGGITVALTDGVGTRTIMTTAGDGSYSFPSVPSSETSGVILVTSPAGYEAASPVGVALDADRTGVDFALQCIRVAVSGTVSSDCDGPAAGLTVTLTDGSGNHPTTTTGQDGTYSFDGILYSGNAGGVAITVPEGFTAASPPDGAASIALTTDQTGIDFTLTCDAVPVSVSGIVSSGCTGPMENVIVGFVDVSDAFDIDTTDASGAYSFDGVAWSDVADAGDISISIPLGFEAASPAEGEATLTLDQDRTMNFELDCVTTTGVARGKGYWKHNARVWYRGRGHAQESQEDMETNYPGAIFDHFHENELNGVAVVRVTYVDEGNGPVPMTPYWYDYVLSYRNRPLPKIVRAKQQYLALLLNIASGKLSTYFVVSEDGRTASQAVQYIADLINDGDPSNDLLAKEIGGKINSAQLLPAGLIPEGYETIYYARPTVEDRPLTVFPNPGGASKAYTLSFTIPVPGWTSLEIFNVAGRRVATFLSGEMPAGHREVTWQGRDSAGRRIVDGVYFARLTTPEGRQTAKFVHLGR